MIKEAVIDMRLRSSGITVTTRRGAEGSKLAGREQAYGITTVVDKRHPELNLKTQVMATTEDRLTPGTFLRGREYKLRYEIQTSHPDARPEDALEAYLPPTNTRFRSTRQAVRTGVERLAQKPIARTHINNLLSRQAA